MQFVYDLLHSYTLSTQQQARNIFSLRRQNRTRRRAERTSYKHYLKMMRGATAWCRLLATLCLSLIPVARCELLTPPYFNLAEGRRISASATCGEGTPGPELYCKLVGANSDDDVNINIIQGQVCAELNQLYNLNKFQLVKQYKIGLSVSISSKSNIMIMTCTK